MPLDERDGGLARDERAPVELDVALARLPDNDRRLLDLLHRYGFAVDEVAAMTGSTPAAVRSAAYRARAAARILLEESP